MDRLKQISYLNSLVGSLNKRDGIQCEACLNKGVVFVDLGEDAIAGVKDCPSCSSKRFEYAQLHNIKIRMLNKKGIQKYNRKERH